MPMSAIQRGVFDRCAEDEGSGNGQVGRELVTTLPPCARIVVASIDSCFNRGAERDAQMRRYSEEFKEATVQKMMPPNPVPVSQLVEETGVSDVTLYKWRKQYRERGFAVPADDTNPDNWKPEDKLAVVIETAAMNEVELGEYCRSKGLYPEQVQRWKRSALMGYQRTDQVDQTVSRNRKEDKQEIKKLKSQLRRKEKALAETAALLVLSKKSRAIWGEPEED